MCQDHGTESMQLFVCQRQRYLKDYVAEAHEWGQAREQTALDMESDWALVCRTAGKECPHGDGCTYNAAALSFFQANGDSISREELGVALRNILLTGPSKTTRAPMIIGPTNSGKSTLILPFDELFGFSRVFHKPALGSSFALRNILKNKRFLLWDDFRPVEYGQKTVPVTTFLSLFQGQPFEVQVSQSFNDGNVDFEWHRGCVLTAKAASLWQPMPGVDDEDIRHMKSRLLLFHCNATIKSLKDTMPCPTCMCKWIVDAATKHDSRAVLAPGPPQVQVGDLAGMAELAEAAKLPFAKRSILESQIIAMGAVHVKELVPADWESLPAFGQLLPFEQRRLLAALPKDHN